MEQLNLLFFVIKEINELYATKILNSSTDLNMIRELFILGSLCYPPIIDFVAYSNKDFEGKWPSNYHQRVHKIVNNLL